MRHWERLRLPPTRLRESRLRPLSPEDNARAKDKFSFVHMTDLHIEPERHAATGCAKCVARINALAPEFVALRRDVVFDAGEVGYPRAKQLYDLYQETLKPLKARVHTVIGNHDLFGVFPKSGAVPTTLISARKSSKSGLARGLLV